MKPSQVKALDKLFSEVIRLRANGYCEYCHKYVKDEGINPAHFWGRSRKSVRWDEDNVHGLCTPCHSMFDNGWNSYNEWLTKRLGEERLMSLLNRMRNTTKLDYETIKTQLQNRIQELQR